MGMAAPQDGEQLTKTELSTAQATAAAELALEALKNRNGGELHGALADAVRASVSKAKVLQIVSTSSPAIAAPELSELGCSRVQHHNG